MRARNLLVVGPGQMLYQHNLKVPLNSQCPKRSLIFVENNTHSQTAGEVMR